MKPQVLDLQRVTPPQVLQKVLSLDSIQNIIDSFTTMLLTEQGMLSTEQTTVIFDISQHFKIKSAILRKGNLVNIPFSPDDIVAVLTRSRKSIELCDGLNIEKITVIFDICKRLGMTTAQIQEIVGVRAAQELILFIFERVGVLQ